VRKTKNKVWKKPFEGCYRIGKNKFTDAGFHDISDEDDKKFFRFVKKFRMQDKRNNYKDLRSKSMLTKKDIPIIGRDFIGRNWLLLARLGRMGFSKEEAIRIAKRMEQNNETMEEAIRKEKERKAR